MSKHSDWTESAVNRRDFRATHNGPEVAKHKRTRTKAEKQRCKRNPATGEHDMELIETHRITWWSFDLHKCKLCGKKDYVDRPPTD